MTTTCLTIPEWRRKPNPPAATIKDSQPPPLRSKPSPPPRRQSRGWGPSSQATSSTSGSSWESLGAIEQARQLRAGRKERGEKLRVLYALAEMPLEEKRKRMYKSLKITTNRLTTQLIEAVYPPSSPLPSIITPTADEGASEDYPRYTLPVNHLLVLAATLAATVEHSDMKTSLRTLLDDAINKRSEYSYWMARLTVGTEESDETHQHFIDVLERARAILSPPPKAAAATPMQPQDSTMGKKRKKSVESLKGTEDDHRKAVKTTVQIPSAPMHPQPQRQGQGQGQGQQPLPHLAHLTWRQTVIHTGDETRCAQVVKKSWAAVVAAGDYGLAF